MVRRLWLVLALASCHPAAGWVLDPTKYIWPFATPAHTPVRVIFVEQDASFFGRLS